MKIIPKLKKETLLKVLIFIGIIAIITSLYIQYGKPYIKELSLEKQDQARIKDLDSLNGVLKETVSASSTKYIGKNKTIYISIPSDDSKCSNLDLPSVPDGWQYHCVATTTLKKTDGTGWIPVNISEKIDQLPIDPINNPETLNYYAYVASSTNQYVFAGALDSKKFLKEKSQSDDGIDNTRYEIGNNLRLLGYAEGLIGYWPMNEGNGTIAHDIINNNNFDLYNANVLSKDCDFINKSLGCLNLSPGDNNLSIDHLNLKSKSMLVTMWVNLSKENKESYEILFAPNSFALYAYDTHPNMDIWSSVYIKSQQIFSSGISSVNYNEWHQIGFYYGYLKNQNYPIIANIIDGQIVNPQKLERDDETTISQLILNNRKLYNGKIWNLKIFNKEQSIEDITRAYSRDLNLLLSQ